MGTRDLSKLIHDEDSKKILRRYAIEKAVICTLLTVGLIYLSLSLTVISDDYTPPYRTMQFVFLLCISQCTGMSAEAISTLILIRKYSKEQPEQ